MDLTPLRNLGLNEHESSIYIVLLEEGSTTAGKLADKTHIHRRTVYDTLNSLKEKGFVSYFENNGVVNFTALDPELLMKLCKEREAELESILPELKSKQERAKTKTGAQLFQGLKAIKTIFEDILSCKEYAAFGEGMRTVNFLGHFFEYFQREKKRRKIKSRVLMGEQFRRQKTVTGSYGEFRFLRDYEPPVALFIYGNKVATIVWSETPTAFVIESQDAVAGYRTYFELMWKNAKK
ncbi:MAG: helix-turn-helix domain-containing protein [Candidatus Woesearchaeota archaeon]|nr:helix-turn-helix domain-containing protein [Candidatus Woesearchaeota archaeon]